MDTCGNYVFEKFAVNETNHFAAEACRALAEGGDGRNWIDWDVNQLLIYGDVGVGKTHLAQSIVNRVMRINPELSVKYITGESFANEILEGIRNNRMTKLRTEYRELDIFVIDNIDYMNNMNAVRSELFHIIDELQLHDKKIVATAGTNPNNLFNDCLELKNLLEGFCSIGIDPPDEDLIAEIVNKMLEKMELDLDEDVMAYVLEYGDGSINKLKGALRTIKSYVDIEDDVDPWLKDIKRILKID